MKKVSSLLNHPTGLGKKWSCVYNYIMCRTAAHQVLPPPVPPGFVARPHLLEKLDEALNHRLTLVSAPAGAGKTTLVSAWVQSAHKKGAVIGWLSLDDADNDLGAFPGIHGGLPGGRGMAN